MTRASGRVSVGGAEIHYEIVGSGPPLLLVHGGTGTGRFDWRRQIARFAGRYEVVLPDLRAHGRSSGQVPSITHAGLAQDLRHLLDALGIGAAHLCGFSAGGIVLTHLALAYPERAQSLTLVGAAYRVEPWLEAGWDHLLETWPTEMRGLHGADRHEGHWEDLMNQLSRDWVESRGFAEDALGALKVPTLIITGDRDENVGLAQSVELYGLLPDARLLVVPNAGHAVQSECPELVGTEILRFVAGLQVEQEVRDTRAEEANGGVRGADPRIDGDQSF